MRHVLAMRDKGCLSAAESDYARLGRREKLRRDNSNLRLNSMLIWRSSLFHGMDQNFDPYIKAVLSTTSTLGAANVEFAGGECFADFR